MPTSHSKRNILVIVIILLVLGGVAGFCIYWFHYRKKAAGGSCTANSKCKTGLYCTGNSTTAGTCQVPTVLTDVQLVTGTNACPTGYVKGTLDLNDQAPGGTPVYMCTSYANQTTGMTGVTNIDFTTGTCNSGTKLTTDLNTGTTTSSPLYMCVTKGTTGLLADVTAVEANTGSTPACPTGYTANTTDLNAGTGATKVINACTETVAQLSA